MNKEKLNQILDANLNRVTEGVRVIEEISRFLFEDKKTTIKLKQFRHSLVNLYKKLPGSEIFIHSRNVNSDPGKDINEKSEYSRENLISLLLSNSGRVKESLRVLEEFTKLLDKNISSGFKSKRFKFYEIEKDILKRTTIKKIDFLIPCLYPIIDAAFCKDLKKTAEILNSSDIIITQLRVKEKPDIEFFHAAETLKKYLNPKITFLINNRFDIALAVEADGVHVGQTDLPFNIIKERLEPGKVIGVSVNTLKEAQSAFKQGADYLGFGPIYHTSTKLDAGKIKTLGLLKKLTDSSSAPVAAIGGITPENTLPLLLNGTKLIAVISSVFNNPAPAKVLKSFNSIIKNFIKEKRKAV
ncbi:MAG TPA: thiamine phosphate synthase [Firmicutes bacterium]|nr:thiamine phosphate synthase [Bacillota bacterium]